HMSFGPIGNIIRKVAGDSSKDSNNEHTQSKETEALKLFQEGKTSVEVAITLNISYDETEDLYLGYLRLNNLHQLVLIYKDMKYQLPSFVKFFNHLRIAGIKEEDVADLIKEAKQIPFLRKTFLDLTNEITNLTAQRNALQDKLSSLQNQVTIHENYLQIVQEELKRMNFKIMEKNRELQELNQLIDDRMTEYISYR
ncbi:MAG: hypothetical protein ACRD8W_28515, partial [Nitrososphaeraceae archaeon]